MLKPDCIGPGGCIVPDPPPLSEPGRVSPRHRGHQRMYSDPALWLRFPVVPPSETAKGMMTRLMLRGLRQQPDGTISRARDAASRR